MRTAGTAAAAANSGWLARGGAAWRPVIAAVAAAGVGIRFGVTWPTPGLMVWAVGLVFLAVSDLERMSLPKRQVYPTLVLAAGWLSVAAGIGGSWARLAWAVAAAVVAEGLFAVVALGWPGSLGFGDVRLVGLVGLGVGWVAPLLVAVSVAAGMVAAGVVALAGVAAGRLSRQSRMPVGAFLAAAGVATVLVWG